MPPPDASTANTPLPPSVEKAYYRKCIELKRRLNEVEEANDAARLRRTRLDRAILKMRLERAFLLEQLGRRMEYVDEEEKEREDGERVLAEREREREREGDRGASALEEEGE
ncbi:hypothetical protein C1H76_3417 [Elsinoe australis]|uniref:Non-histone protein 10 n=1 Tax=Elsinoe australis TaxID=40998 RepID=A0A2P7YGH8_9PEZI|nr:Non-histone protein 10 [Elsinoe australis]TKX24313.1 hypothetical protein C1H76_3417 [Elsinoe australis]